MFVLDKPFQHSVMQHSGLVDPFESNEENEVLWTRYQVRNIDGAPDDAQVEAVAVTDNPDAIWNQCLRIFVLS